MFDIDNPQLAALAWSRIVEPGDAVAGALVQALGPSEALRWLYQTQSETLAPAEPIPGSLERLLSAAEGWRVRLPGLDPAQDLQNGERIGAELLLPSDPRWPARLADLGPAAPHALWVRGQPDLDIRTHRSVALVGSRASTQYGEQVTADLAIGLAERGFAIISGGAYGIDAAAHRGALVANSFTVALMAGGIDRMYPAGNTALLREVCRSGALVSEVPPGSVPYRNRFLARNRLIAALAGATIVVQAAWRSGALSTARHAEALLRPVGAVPGPVTSMASGGCHQLIRDGIAMLVTDAAEIAELAGATDDAASPPQGASEVSDGLTREQKRVYDILPMRNYLSPPQLSRTAGLPLAELLSALGILELRGLAQSNGSAWRRGGGSEVEAVKWRQ